MLEQLEEQVQARGGVVHWARDAQEANAIVTRLVRATGADEVVKVKSMATQEIGLNEALEEAGIAAWETDLAELIVQLGHDRPSHIMVPAIHRNRQEVLEIFQREMPGLGTELPDGLTADPRELARRVNRTRNGLSGMPRVTATASWPTIALPSASASSTSPVTVRTSRPWSPALRENAVTT